MDIETRSFVLDMVCIYIYIVNLYTYVNWYSKGLFLESDLE